MPRATRSDVARNHRAILVAARRLLAEQPDASLAEVAQAAGLGRATIYRYYAAKPDLLRAIGRQAVADFLAAMEDAEPDEGDAAEALRRMIERVLAIDAAPALLVGLRDDRATTEEQRRASVEPLIRTVARGQAAGELRDDLPPAWIVHAIVRLHTLALELVRDGVIAEDDAARLLSSTLLDGTRAPEPVGRRA
jgi:AcrR family transcriptional regulator